MSVWGWPQFLVAIVCIVGFVVQVAKTLRDRSLTSTRATIVALVTVAYYAFYVYTLHAGRFW